MTITWRSRRFPQFFVFVGTCLLLGVPASATLTYSCDATVNALNGGGGNVCATLNGTIASLYTNTFNDVNAQIYITMGATALGQSTTANNAITYAAYLAALTADRTSADDTTAVASLPAGPNLPAPFPSSTMRLSNANVRALPTLGVTPTSGVDSAGNACTIVYSGGGANYGTTCFDGQIIISNAATLWFRTGLQPGTAYDFFSVAEHETDEVLGHGSCVFDNAGNKPGCTVGGVSRVRPMDLFRFSGNGARTYTAGDNAACSVNEATNACFSINGGGARLLSYNNVCAGASCNDAGDFSANCQFVQDQAGCQGEHGQSHDINVNAEIKELDVIGYTFVPEPATVSLFAFGLAVLGASRWKRRSN